jgi:SAM-dependent methyltransferase
MRREDFTTANREAWNEVAPIHAQHNHSRLLERFRTPSYSCLDQLETERLTALGLQGKAVAQLACNNGRELLSIKNLGAGRCVGFDISTAFIAQANDLARASTITCEFVCTDVYEIPQNYDRNFDLVYISIGVLNWMPDLDAFFAVSAHLLRAAGSIFIYDSHPLLDMLDEEDRELPVKLRDSYFDWGGEPDTLGLDYYGNTPYAARPHYAFHHTLSNILGGLIRNGLAIHAFDEYAHDISGGFPHLQGVEPKLPMSFMLIGQKQM